MKPKRCPPALALALALLILAPALSAQESPEAEGLEGSWTMVMLRTPDDASIPFELVPDVSTVFTFEGGRYTFRVVVPKRDVIVDEAAGTFEAAGGVLRLIPDEDGEPENIPYTLEDGVLSLHFMEDETIVVTIIFRRES